jgi:hypothetical protein
MPESLRQQNARARVEDTGIHQRKHRRPVSVFVLTSMPPSAGVLVDLLSRPFTKTSDPMRPNRGSCARTNLGSRITQMIMVARRVEAGSANRSQFTN